MVKMKKMRKLLLKLKLNGIPSSK